MLRLIKDRWKEQNENLDAVEQMWDVMAEDYRLFSIPKFSEDSFLKLLEEHNFIRTEDRVLDIGCGTARYSIALAARVRSVTGVDVSPKMIAYGREAVNELGINNVTLYQMPWNGEETKKIGDSYDLVIAHMTPAIRDFATFQKMLSIGSHRFAYSKPMFRKSELLEGVRKAAGRTKQSKENSNHIPYMFTVLWQQGILPKLYYEEQVWESEHPIEVAAKRFLTRLRTAGEVSHEQEKAVMDYLSSAQKEGIIYEQTKTTVVTMLWEK